MKHFVENLGYTQLHSELKMEDTTKYKHKEEILPLNKHMKRRQAGVRSPQTKLGQAGAIIKCIREKNQLLYIQQCLTR